MSINVAILGATGVVGIKAITLLLNNPKFKVIELVASDERIGQSFGEIYYSKESLIKLPENIANIKLSNAKNLKAAFVISCLPADVAKQIEPKLASEGKIVFSNASAFRMNKDVPLLVPEINEAHLTLLRKQKTSGKIITNPNCSAVGITLALAPLMDLAEIKHISVVTLQAISGAGYPGIPSLDILSNTIPHIEGEAEKITAETKKILGNTEKSASFAVTTNVHRVPVRNGHTATLHVTFKKQITSTQAKNAYQTWNKKYPDLFVLHNQIDRPQSIKDLDQNDMRVHIGGIRQGDNPNILTVTALTHNLVRGAAGAVIANMEKYSSFLEKKN